MDAQALVAALVGATTAAAVCYRAGKREWWAASGLLAIGAAALLNAVTEGNRSHFEHSVVFSISLSLLLWFAIAVGVHHSRIRRRSDSRASDAGHSRAGRR
jgi:hypothetical protein